MCFNRILPEQNVELAAYVSRGWVIDVRVYKFVPKGKGAMNEAI